MSILPGGAVCEGCGAVIGELEGQPLGSIYAGGVFYDVYSVTRTCWNCGMRITQAWIPSPRRQAAAIAVKLDDVFIRR
jgi:hypothetical protein